MKPRIRRALWMIAIAVVAAAPASAAPPTTLFLTFTPAQPEVGQSVELQWVAGAGREAQAAPWPDEGVAWMLIRAGGGQQNRHDVRPARNGDRTVAVEITQPGVTVIGIDQRPVISEMTGAELREYIERHVGDPAVREKARELAADRTYRVQHVASAKVLVRTRSADSNPRPAALAMSKTGQAAELRPAADPTALRVGSDLPVTAYIEGAKKEKIRILATNGATGRTATFQEVSGGSGYFRIGEAGPWRVEFHHAAPVSDHKDAEWIIYTATLSFDVAASGGTP